MRRPVLLAVAAGVLETLALPPFGWWVLAFGGIALLVSAVEDRSVRERAWIGLAFGVAFLAPGLFWMTEFSLPGWVLAMLTESAFTGLAVVIAPRRGWLALTLPAAFVLSDRFRGAWPWGGVQFRRQVPKLDNPGQDCRGGRETSSRGSHFPVRHYFPWPPATYRCACCRCSKRLPGQDPPWSQSGRKTRH